MELDYQKRLTDAGVKLSIQRLAIYAYIFENKNHPDIETIYLSLHPRFPTLSKTTVYNTMKLFEEKELVQFIKIEDDKLRFDCEMKNHIHFKCLNCNSIFDVFYKETEDHSKYNSMLPKGFVASSVQTYIWGTCNNCTK